MTDRIQDILESKYTNNKMAHFYIINPSTTDTSSQLLEWTSQLICKLSSIKQQQIENHQDILLIKSASDVKQYPLEDINRVFDFTAYRAVELKKKFLIIEDANKLTTLHSNKLLKTFEEPPVEMIIFLLNPKKTNIINTINSRAIKLNIKINKEHQQLNLEELIKLDFQSFSSKLTNSKLAAESIYTELLNSVNKVKISRDQAIGIKRDLDLLAQDFTFNSSWQNKAFKVYSLLKSLK